jgi:hypothetical protein
MVLRSSEPAVLTEGGASLATNDAICTDLALPDAIPPGTPPTTPSALRRDAENGRADRHSEIGCHSEAASPVALSFAIPLTWFMGSIAPT